MLVLRQISGRLHWSFSFKGRGPISAIKQRIPAYEGDPFSEANLRSSAQVFKEIRDQGPVVWSPSLNAYIIARYSDVQAALRAPDILISGQGVSLNPDQNAASSLQTSAILSDGEEHRRFQQVVMRPIGPKSVNQIKDRVYQLAKDQVLALANGQTFEAMSTLASHLPLSIVAEMVGIKNVDNDRMLGWSNAIFDFFIPFRAEQAAEQGNIMFDFIGFMQGLKREDLDPDGWAYALFEAADDGKITEQEAQGLIGDFIVPSLDTTIYSTGQMLFGLASDPEAWAKVKGNPGLVSGVIDEAVRIATPLRGFTRSAAEDYTVGDHTIPQGARVWLLYGAANLDERKYPNPNVFDVERNPKDHLGWGHGVHLCLGKHLARLEMEAILNTLIENVAKMEVDEPTRIMNNSAQGFGNLPMRLFAA